MSGSRVRMRPDLVIERAAASDRWVVLDPVALRYFELRDEECAVLRMLDGRSEFAELRTRFERLFAPARLSASMLETFVHRLHAAGLVLADTPGQGHVWAARRQAARRRAVWTALANPLAIRLPALGAAAAVARLSRVAGWLFSPLATLVAAATIGWAALVAAAHSDELARELPRALAWFDGSALHGPGFAGTAGLGWLATLAVVKCCHELGHALLLARWGGRVHAVGAMLFVFAPALYCDVSDAWRLQSRWQRVAVGMAGIWVELLLASAALAVWRLTGPGLGHALALKTMVVCTLGTVMFNANPLVRGDAYYVLSDLVGVPNLASESREALSAWMRGVPVEGGFRAAVGRWALAAYGLASLACLAFFYWTALRWTASALQPLGLAELARILAVVVVAGIAGPPTVRAVSAWRRPAAPRPGRWRRHAWVGAGLIAAAALVWLVPMPRRVWAPIRLELARSQAVYVTVPGTLVWRLPAGTRVAPGDPIARLANEPLADRQRSVAAAVAIQERRVAQLHVLLSSDASLAPSLPVEDERLRSLREQQSQLAGELERLVLKADRAGVIIEPPHRHASPAEATGGPARWEESWDGSPFEPRNLGCYLEAGTTVCEVGEPAELEGHAWVSLVDLPGVRVGQTAHVRFDSAPAIALAGTVSDLARGDSARSLAGWSGVPGAAGFAGPGGAQSAGTGGAGAVPGAMSTAGPLSRAGPSAAVTVSQPFARVDESAAGVLYEARIALPTLGGSAEAVTSGAVVPGLLPGARGWARIDADWEPLGKRLWRSARRTFRE